MVAIYGYEQEVVTAVVLIGAICVLSVRLPRTSS